MLFYLYSAELEQSNWQSALLSQLESSLKEVLSDPFELEIEDDMFEDEKHIRAYCPELWSFTIHPAPETGDRVFSSAYFLKALPIEAEAEERIRNHTCRLRVIVNSVNPEFPEDVVEAIHVLSGLPNAVLFGPLASYRAKMEAFEKQITKARVVKMVEPIVANAMERMGFSPDGKLQYRRSEEEFARIGFFTNSELEDAFCTRASFSVFFVKGWERTDLLDKEGCWIWYVEPDGSNLEALCTELRAALERLEH